MRAYFTTETMQDVYRITIKRRYENQQEGKQELTRPTRIHMKNYDAPQNDLVSF